MENLAHDENAPYLVDLCDAETINVLGPTIQFLTSPEKGDNDPCVMRGTIPPGVHVPLHSHPDPETFLAISGEIEGLTESDGCFRWVRIKPDDVFHVPGGAKHAFRNLTGAQAVMIIVSTNRIGRFFREVGTPTAPGAQSLGPPSNETIRHFLETADKYGYWNASPEENARAGISIPPLAG
jgi:quercetin dioxygenase-like cupin family protein